jgi:hypothetical protein
VQRLRSQQSQKTVKKFQRQSHLQSQKIQRAAVTVTAVAVVVDVVDVSQMVKA